MTSTDLVVVEGASLALDPEQTYFTDAQVKALEHIGVENASQGDLQVFHHVCQRSGLDPFARQIHMIGRQVSVFNDQTNQWDKVTKQTIQTGIDGFRLIGRRAANGAGHTVSVGAPDWAHEDGSWRPVWMRAWGEPVAARVTIKRNGEPFTAVALFDEYKQTKRSGDLTSMWNQRPAGQLAKCAEALAWRMAFPQDLSGLYVDEEMQQADTIHGEVVEQRGLGAALAAQNSDPDPVVAPTAESPGPSRAGEDEPSGSEPDIEMTKRTRGQLFALFTQKGVDETEQLPGINHITGKTYTSRADITEADGLAVIEVLLQRPDVQKEADQ